jgi:hypothetical protein
MLQKFINYIAELLRIKRKPKEAEKRGADDIYPMW